MVLVACKGHHGAPTGSRAACSATGSSRDCLQVSAACVLPRNCRDKNHQTHLLQGVRLQATGIRVCALAHAHSDRITQNALKHMLMHSVCMHLHVYSKRHSLDVLISSRLPCHDLINQIPSMPALCLHQVSRPASQRWHMRRRVHLAHHSYTQ